MKKLKNKKKYRTWIKIQAQNQVTPPPPSNKSKRQRLVVVYQGPLDQTQPTGEISSP